MIEQVFIEELTCKPLDSYQDILLFLENPPPWRSLCKELTPHSKSKIKNIEINNHYEISLEKPETFCHFNPDVKDPNRYDKNDLPKTLVCHDMANGYADDSYIDDTGNSDAYNFYNWAGIDIFCYFSHHLITIPPLSWINVGHTHGVKVIGTVITEWADGMDFWDKILETEAKYQDFASALVAIAKTLKFDGWLLNVENKINKPEMLLSFVQHLNTLLHQDIPHAKLIWYDSVTVSGHLNWQNGLNDKNRAFFDACDGIFTNYSWTEFDLTTSSIEAGDRIRDLYIGIDVWGRNFYGGGEFNTQEAIKLVYEQGCSMAIFAPAWTHEAMSDDTDDLNAVLTSEQLDRSEQFRLRDRVLWGSIWPFLNTSLPCELPFQTSFCRGQGKKKRLHGEVISPEPWFNLRHQEYQPNSAHGPHGYMLSTHENILDVEKCQSVFKDPKGIIRYRKSFLATRQELHSTCTMSVLPDSTEPRELKFQKLDERKGAEGRPIDTSVKSRIKRAFKRIFGSKSPKTSAETINVDEPSGTSEREEMDDAKPSTSTGRLSKTLVSSTGKSMVTMSINLRLGRSTATSKVRLRLIHVPQENECLEVWEQDCFTGGSCLRVHPSDEVCLEHRTTKLFHCDLLCVEALVACVVTKALPEAPLQSLNVLLEARGQKGRETHIVLVGSTEAAGTRACRAGSASVLSLSPLDVTDVRFKAIQKYLLVKEPGFYIPVENSFDWFVRYYEIVLPDSRIVSINLRTVEAQGPILFGHFGLCPIGRLPN